MRIILSLILLTSVFSDFALASFEFEEGISECQSRLDCNDIDLHDSNEEKHHDDKHTDHHCHIGHTHIGLLPTIISKIQINLTVLKNGVPSFIIGSLSDYFSKINRPPIS